MNKPNLLAAMMVMVIGMGADRAVAQETSPLRLSMNVLELEQAAGGTESVARDTMLRLRGFGQR